MSQSAIGPKALALRAMREQKFAKQKPVKAPKPKKKPAKV